MATAGEAAAWRGDGSAASVRSEQVLAYRKLADVGAELQARRLRGHRGWARRPTHRAPFLSALLADRPGMQSAPPRSKTKLSVVASPRAK